jgi:hypothetical protein
MIKEILDPKIFYYKSLIANPKAFVKRIEDLDLKISHPLLLSSWQPWVSSTKLDDVFGQFKTGPAKFSFVSEEEKESALILSTIDDIFNMCVEDYSKHVDMDLGYLPNEITIRKYNPGGQMGPHIDCEDNDDESRLTASMVLYLNDDFEGGEVEFPQQGIRLKPEPGSLLIFPSTKPYYHASSTIISGNKYMCPNFMFRSSKLN